MRLDVEAPAKSAGLTAADAEARLAVFGQNVLTPPKTRPLWLQFLLKVRAATRRATQATSKRKPHCVATRRLRVRSRCAVCTRPQFTDKFMLLLLLAGALCHLAWGCVTSRLPSGVGLRPSGGVSRGLCIDTCLCLRR